MMDAAIRQEHNLRWLKRWIWLYFWLLIFEGSLRKWALPSLSAPLLLVRDPVVLIVYLQAFRCRKLSMRSMWPVALLALVMILLACAQVVTGVNTPSIAAYGLRSYLLHVPLVFLLADVLSERDVHAFGRWLMLLMIPMAVLVLFQYKAPASAWVNAGAGEGAAQISSAGSHIRPAGTFSYGIGMQFFVVLVGAFVLDAILQKGKYRRGLIYAALFAVIACLPMLGSRTAVFLMCALASFTLFAGSSHVARLGGLMKIGAMVLLGAVIAFQLPVFRDALGTLETRWLLAQRTEGDVQQVINDRVLDTFKTGLESAATTPWLGQGIGMGSNYAAIVTTGAPWFLMGESEWERVVPEMGPFCGLLFLSARVALALYLLLCARRALSRGAALAWLLVPAVVPVVLMGIMEQATYLGFMVFGAGLCLAAARHPQSLALRWESSMPRESGAWAS
jgi:hypothetical protein